MKWQLRVKGTVYGPFDGAGLKQLAEQSRMSPTDSISKDGGKTWHVAGKVQGLFPAAPVVAKPILPPVSTPPPAPPAPAQYAAQPVGVVYEAGKGAAFYERQLGRLTFARNRLGMAFMLLVASFVVALGVMAAGSAAGDQETGFAVGAVLFGVLVLPALIYNAWCIYRVCFSTYGGVAGLCLTGVLILCQFIPGANFISMAVLVILVYVRVAQLKEKIADLKAAGAL